MKRIALGAMLLALVVVGAPSLTHAESTQLPNLVPWPPYDFEIGAPDQPNDSLLPIPVLPYGIEVKAPASTASSTDSVLRFSVSTMNLGRFPLDLLGVPQDALHTAKAYQCMAWTTRVCTDRAEVGVLGWHDEHKHYHFPNFATYELRTLDVDGNPVMDESGLLSTSEKVSFCLEDVFPSTSADTPEQTIYWVPTYRACTLLTQGISAGWEDQYARNIPGQQLEIAGVPDGTYAVVITSNPAHSLHETSYDDNVAFTRITLSEGGTVVTAEQPPVEEPL